MYSAVLERRMIRMMILAAILIIGLSTLRGNSGLMDYFELRHSRDSLQVSIETLESEIRYLETETERIEKSPDYARKVLRELFHVTEEDETIVFFAD
ncbi:MAG: septum formation initiator family protein [Deltaproteobacteria bacterium]|nr:septum formation initiator family protein [Deltaproteobacteria bacterium]